MQKNKIVRELLLIFTISILAIGIFVFLRSAQPDFVQQPTYQESETFVKIGDSTVSVEIANTYAQRAKGLSGRESLDEDAGMFFVFESSDNWSFWMKDMQFALDIIWINENLEIVHIEQNVLPESFPAIYASPTQAKYVLEVNAGFVKRHVIKVGDIVILQNF